MSVNFAELPDEVIQTILSHALPSAALSLGRTSRRFRDVANEPQLWKAYCHATFNNWSGDYGFRHRLPDPAIDDWKQTYISRDASSNYTRRTLEQISREPLHRIGRIDSIVKLGLDIKDDLLAAFDRAPGTEYHLAQKYWAHTALGCLHRSLAVKQWIRLKFREPTEESFELALGAFDLFILEMRRTGDIADIFARLDGYAEEIRVAHPNIDSFTPQTRACLIAQYLLEKEYIGISAGHHYHSLDHMFLGVALFSPLRNSLPLISATIFCAVARRFNLRAAPCSFPFHVHAVVSAPDGLDLNGNLLPTTATEPPADTNELTPASHPHTSLFLDPFHSADPIPTDTLITQLSFIARRRNAPNFTPAQIAAFLSPSPPRDMTYRAALNLQSSPQHSPPPPSFPISATSADYAASWALTLLPSRHMQLRQHLPILFAQFVQSFPYDLPLIQAYIMPLTHSIPQAPHFAQFIRGLQDEDAIPKTPKLRTDPAHQDVKFRVGQVFRHRIRGYLACIVGWDPQCAMPDEWIVMNQVARLDRGKHQPFYNVIVDDTTPRYVAEDNVILLSLAEAADLDVESVFPIEIGKHFKSWDASRGCLCIIWRMSFRRTKGLRYELET